MLIAPLFVAAAPATSALADDPPADPPGDSSPIGDGGSSPLGEYIEGSIVNKDGSELTVGKVSDNACVTLSGVVSPADIPEQYRTTPPAGEGKWEYQVCAANAADAQKVVNDHPTIGSVKAYCATEDRAPAAQEIACAVFAYWHPKINTPPPAPDQSRDSYFESFFQFSPDLGTSPPNATDLGLIANFPTWVWNKVVTTFPKAIGDLGLLGGLAATAWHLNTTLETNDTDGQICSDSGLRMVGKVWDDGFDPASASPDCGHTYHNMGIYNIHGCSQWLIIAVGPFFAIVFPITVCSDTTMTVKESQILTGGDATRARVR